MRYSSMSPNSSSAAASLGAPTRTPRSVFAFSAEIASRRSPSTLIVFCHGKSLREPDTTYFAFASSFCAHSRIARRLFVACHRGPGSLHQLVGVAPEEHRPALIQELCPIVVQLVVHDPLGVIDAPVQSHVETEGEEAHGVGFYEKRSHRRNAPSPVGIGAQKLDTIESITRICCALRAETKPHRGRYSTRFVERILMTAPSFVFETVFFRPVGNKLTADKTRVPQAAECRGVPASWRAQVIA